MPNLYPFLRPLIFALDAERAHRLVIAAARFGLAGRARVDEPILATSVAGLHFPNPVGLAAGFDKDAEVPAAMLRLGFGFVEVGTLTPRPQAGNPKPRLFRLVEDAAVINRMGFNNGGLEKACTRLARRNPADGIVGVNVGANKDSADRIADYVLGVRHAEPVADYITINISSPNTPGLRALQSRESLAQLLEKSLDARARSDCPVFLKVAPDLTAEDVADIADVAMGAGISGLIISNTTITRPETLRSRYAQESGGLSGAPLKEKALAMLQAFANATQGRLPLIAAGGIASGADAYARIRAGASLVQLYSALVYHGPMLAQRINLELAALLRRDGFDHIGEAVGADRA